MTPRLSTLRTTIPALCGAAFITSFSVWLLAVVNRVPPIPRSAISSHGLLAGVDGNADRQPPASLQRANQTPDPAINRNSGNPAKQPAQLPVPPVKPPPVKAPPEKAPSERPAVPASAATETIAIPTLSLAGSTIPNLPEVKIAQVGPADNGEKTGQNNAAGNAADNAGGKQAMGRSHSGLSAPGANDVDTPPREYPSNRQPRYPPADRAAGIEGDVLLRLLIDKQGVVATVQTIEGRPSFRRAVEAVVKEWRFTAARNQGKTVAVWGVKRFRFRVHSR